MYTFKQGICGLAGLASKVAVGIALALAATQMFAADSIQNEVLASPNRRILDPEFNKAKGLMTWVDIFDGSIYVGGVDRSTGALVPADGKGVLIEKSAAPRGGLGFTLNGPEWVLGASSDYIVYTRFVPGAPPTPAGATIRVAARNADGTWALKTLAPGTGLNAPYGSEQVDDPSPRITYNDQFGSHYWRELNDRNTTELIPKLYQTGLLPVVRHVRGDSQRAVVYPVATPGGAQVFRYDLNTKIFEQVTSDAGTKDQPWMWQAPDFGNELVLLATVDKSTLGLYKQGIDAGGVLRWLRVQSIQSPLGGQFFSTEPFVYGGRSYVLFQVIVGSYPNSIWLAHFDLGQPMLRRLTPELPDRARADPEIFFTDNGPIVFFSRFDQTKGNYWLCVPCAEGLYRAETGIPALN